MSKQFIHEFESYAVAEKYLIPSMEQNTYAESQQQLEDNKRIIEVDLVRTDIYVQSQSPSDYLQQYAAEFRAILNFTQGDPYGGPFLPLALDIEKTLIKQRLLPSLKNDGSADDDYNWSQKVKLFHVSYLNEDNKIEGFVMYINREDPARYVVMHGINLTGKRSKDSSSQEQDMLRLKLHYGLACRGIEGENSRAKLSSNAAEQFPACVGNSALRQALQASINSSGNFNFAKLDDLFESYCYIRKTFDKPMPLLKVCGKFSQMLAYMKKRYPVVKKDEALCSRQQIFMALYNSLAEDDSQVEDYSEISRYFSEKLSADKLTAFRQCLAAVTIKETVGKKTMQQIYPELFTGVKLSNAALPVVKGSILVGLNPGGFFAKRITLWRNEQNSFQGCLQQLAEAAKSCAEMISPSSAAKAGPSSDFVPVSSAASAGM